MARYAVIESGSVDNIIEWDGSAAWPDASKCVLITAEETNAVIGASYDGSSFSYTPPAVPALSYDVARRRDYPSPLDFLEAYTEKEIGSDSTKWDAYVIAYNKVRTDNPKP